jgi:uncharacterized SAM-binding protein YcdF (DUF218 family)
LPVMLWALAVPRILRLFQAGPGVVLWSCWREMSLAAIFTALLLPPLGFLLGGFASLVLVGRGHRAGLALAGAAALGQLLLATPFVAGWLIVSLEREVGDAVPPSPVMSPAAIVVLGGDYASTSLGTDAGPLTLERLRTGAALHRRTGLPLLVTAGPLTPEQEPLASIMARSLEEDFGVGVRWIESRARDTRDNARYSAAILREESIHTVYLVTHAWHMPRAVAAFRRAGLVVVPAPLPLMRVPDGKRLSDWVPRADRLGVSWYALREWAGQLIYALRDY